MLDEALHRLGVRRVLQGLVGIFESMLFEFGQRKLDRRLVTVFEALGRSKRLMQARPRSLKAALASQQARREQRAFLGDRRPGFGLKASQKSEGIVIGMGATGDPRERQKQLAWKPQAGIGVARRHHRKQRRKAEQIVAMMLEHRL